MPSVLVVCTGNICRSPLGEAFLRARLGDGVEVGSSGTDGLDAAPATTGSVVAGGELGVDLAAHRSRRLTVGQVQDAALVLCMERAHRDAVVRAVPSAAARTFTLKELVHLLEVDGRPDGDLEARVGEASRRRTRGVATPADLDVADPYGSDLESYRRTAAEIDGWTARLADLLVGAGEPIARGA